MEDLISRKATIDLVKRVCGEIMNTCGSHFDGEDEVFDSTKEVDAILRCNKAIRSALRKLPSAKYDRDTPKKPVGAIDQAWCAPHRQAVCPRCANLIDYFTLGFGKGKRITYCKFCGQALDWKGWTTDE